MANSIVVLVTRPEGQNEKLAQLLREAGMVPVLFPTLAIESIESQELISRIQQLDQFDFVIFTSSNAVKHSQHLIKQYWPQIPSHIQLAAIGASTKKAIEDNGWKKAIYPDPFNSEALLKIPELHSVKNKSILVITGKNSRDYLLNTLVERGALAKEAVCYQRKMPDYSTSAIMQIARRHFDFIVCSSNESLANLAKMVDKSSFDNLRNSQLISFSERLTPLAEQLGFILQPVVAPSASDEAIIEAINNTKGLNMSSKKKTQQESVIKEHTPAASGAAGPKKENPLQNQFKSVPLLSIITVVIAILALVETAYVSSKLNNLVLRQSKSNTRVLMTANSQIQQFANLTAEISALKQAVSNNSAQISENQTAIHSVQQFKQSNSKQLVLTEIKYLLNMTNYNLRFGHSTVMALPVLDKINQELNKLDDPATLTLQQDIVNVIAQFKALPKIQVAGTLMQLNAIGDQLGKMPLIIPQMTTTTVASPAGNNLTGWRKYWHQSLKTLSKLVVIRHQNTAMEPLVSPNQQLFLEENIQFRLSQAAWGLLQQNQAVYQQSLQDVTDWIQKYYDANSGITANVLSSLQNLLKINVQPKLPDLTAAITEINTLLNAGTAESKGAK